MSVPKASGSRKPTFHYNGDRGCLALEMGDALKSIDWPAVSIFSGVASSEKSLGLGRPTYARGPFA